MNSLPSGLPERVADDERLIRFLTDSNRFNGVGVKHVAFLPNPKHRNTSVFRGEGDKESGERLWNSNPIAEKRLKALAIVTAAHVRASGLEVKSEEPPHRHANIENWCSDYKDEELAKAENKKLAMLLASKAKLIIC
jgi:hypothetical protein